MFPSFLDGAAATTPPELLDRVRDAPKPDYDDSFETHLQRTQDIADAKPDTTDTNAVDEAPNEPVSEDVANERHSEANESKQEEPTSATDEKQPAQDAEVDPPIECSRCDDKGKGVGRVAAPVFGEHHPELRRVDPFDHLTQWRRHFIGMLHPVRPLVVIPGIVDVAPRGAVEPAEWLLDVLRPCGLKGLVGEPVVRTSGLEEIFHESLADYMLMAPSLCSSPSRTVTKLRGC